MAGRTALNVAFEVATDVCKNVILSDLFRVLPASVRPVLQGCDLVLVGSALGVAAGVNLAGVALSSAWYVP